MQIKPFFLLFFSFFLTGSLSWGQQGVGVTVENVKDTRTTGNFSQMEIEFKLIGDMLYDVEGVKMSIKKAVDNKRRNLIEKNQMHRDNFETSQQKGKFSISKILKNPARSATQIKEISGELLIFSPKKDPKSVVMIENFMTKTGKPLEHPLLKKAGIQYTVLNKEQFDAQKKNETRQKVTPPSDDEKIGKTFVQAFSMMFGGMNVSENGLAFKKKDPNNKIIQVEILDKNRNKIPRNSYMTMNEVSIAEYDNPMPENAVLKFYLSTPKSISKAPFKIKNVPLP